MITLIGLKGPKRCGKDELFQQVAQQADPVTRVSIGDEIRREASLLTGIPVEEFDRIKELHRPLLQWLGQWRRHMDPDYWMRKLASQIDAVVAGLVVVTDLRGFPDEMDFMAARGGHVIRIDRRGAGAGDNHPAETMYLSSGDDYVVSNNGTLEDLSVRAAELLTWLRAKETRPSPF